MWSFVNIKDVARKKELRIELPDLKKPFSLKDLKIKKSKLVLNIHGKEHGNYYKVEKGENCRYATIEQIIITDDDKHFSRRLQIRIDNTYHDGYDIHINLDLIDEYKEENGLKIDEKNHREKLGEFHMNLIRGRQRGLFFVSMSIPGQTKGIPVVCFTNKEDLDYHKEWQTFFKKFKEGKLTKEDEIEHKKRFDSYCKILQKRKNNVKES